MRSKSKSFFGLNIPSNPKNFRFLQKMADIEHGIHSSGYPHHDDFAVVKTGFNPEIILLILAGIVVLALVIWVILLLSSKKGNTEGEPCQREDDCSSGHFCGGDFKCHPGPKGIDEGGKCELTRDCAVSLVCTKGFCVNPTDPVETDLSSFDEKIIQTTINNQLYNLWVEDDGKGSFWRIQTPSYTYSYSEGKNELSLVGPLTTSLEDNDDVNPVKIFTDGSLTLGSPSTINFIQNTNDQIFMKDQHENKFSFGLDESFPKALFIDREHYPNIPDTLTGSPAILTLADSE